MQGCGWAVVGYDSLASDDSRIYHLPESQGKVVRRGRYLLGAAGDMRAINLLSDVLVPPTPPPAAASHQQLDKFVSSKFIPAIKKCFDAAQYGEKGEHDSNIILVVNAVIYDIGPDYGWCRDSQGLYAMGSGGEYAMGALSALAQGKNSRTLESAEKMVITAVQISCRLDQASAEPVNILTQHSKN